MLLQWIAIEPGLMYLAFDIFKETSHSIDREQIQHCISLMLQEHSHAGHNSVLSWYLWGFILLELPLSAGDVAVLSKVDDPIVALLFLAAVDRGLASESDAPDGWRKLISAECLMDEAWLLTYEAATKGWLGADKNIFKSSPQFRLLAENRISFFKLDRIDTYDPKYNLRRFSAEQSSY